MPEAQLDAAVAILPVSDEQEARLERDAWSRRRGRPPYPHLSPGVVRLTGRLDRGALQAALAVVRGRHEALRERLACGDAGWHARVEEDVDLDVRFEDLSQAAASEATLERVVEEETNALFDVDGGPLQRALLVRLADDEHVLVVTTEHLVCDGWSVGIVLHELGAAYGRLAAGGDPRPPSEDVVQFPEFAQWQRERLQGELLERLLAFWRDRLGSADPAPSFAFPFARPGAPEERRLRGETVRAELGAPLSTELRALCRRVRTTPFVVLTAALHALVHRYTDAQRIVVPAPVAGRRWDGTEGSVGWYATRLPVVADLDPATTGAALLEQVRDFAFAAYDYEDLPYARLVSALGPAPASERDPEPRYDADVTINLITRDLMRGFGELSFGDLRPRLCDFPRRGARSTLAFTVGDAAGGYAVTLRYDAAELDRETAHSVLRDYSASIRRLVSAPERPVASIELEALRR